jgi:ubiquinone/menaquinone biosynthesis C-methylase UbiE
MELSEAVRLIEKGVEKTLEQRWLDLGAGDGLFTRALAHIIEAPSEITAVDLKRSRALSSISLSPHVIHTLETDFTLTKNLPGDVEGILMANALHFVREKKAFLKSLSGILKDRGRLIIIEYDLQKSNPWVPHPITQTECITLVNECGFSDVRIIGERNSTLNNAVIYSLCCVKA